MARGSETRMKILDVAQAAILTKGFDATSIDEIVAAAEILRSFDSPQTTVLAHFCSRACEQNLLTACHMRQTLAAGGRASHPC